MKSFLQGLAVGGALVAATLMGYAYGTDREHDRNADELESMCRVNVGIGRPSFSNRCYMGEVMVGIETDYVLCADVNVDCN
ncbi:hypothetical protein E3A20_02030 [Planctomyces bekefii]|uniref:Uncharacterized protein n=1 Tax=Planctomyces bekefii TaxID=1653850 RepID=A0A5C6MHF9_9PLAN|nr:hypothetical protein E3A20_02030 [Planctomyces bekefii]